MTTETLTIKRGQYLTDDRELVQIVSVTTKGVRVENVVTLEKRLVQPTDLIGWHEVKPAKEPR